MLCTLVRLCRYHTEIGTGSYAQSVDYLMSDGDQVGQILGATGQTTRRFRYGIGVDNVLSEQRFSGGTASNPEYQLTDHLGTVRGVAQRTTGANAAVVNTLQYDSFGKLISQSNTAKQPYHGFAGRDIEPVGGLTYNRNRYYSTQTGRFISQAPIGFNAGDENLYRYVGNSPTNATDPSGLFQLPVHIKLIVTGVNGLGLPDTVVRGLGRGVVHPDIQYMPLDAAGLPTEDIVAAQYWVTNLMQPFSDFTKQAKEMGWENAKSIGSYWAPSTYAQLRELRNWWQDSSVLPGAVDSIHSLLASGGMDEYSPKELGIYKTHFEELSWLHVMPDKNESDSAEKFQQRLATYIAAQIEIYRNLVDKGDGYHAGFELGKAIHMIHDSHSPSHTVRDEKGRISQFQYYGDQSPTLHGAADSIEQNSELFRRVQRITSEFVRLANDRSLEAVDLESRIKVEFLPITDDCKVGGASRPFRPRN